MARTMSAGHFERVAWWYAREEIGARAEGALWAGQRSAASIAAPRQGIGQASIDAARQIVRTRFYRRDSGCEFPLPFRVLNSSGKLMAISRSPLPPARWHFRSPLRLPTDQPAFLVILSPIDLAAGKASIENVNRCGASSAAGSPISHPDDNSCQAYKNDQRDDQAHADLRAYRQSPIDGLRDVNGSPGRIRTSDQPVNRNIIGPFV